MKLWKKFTASVLLAAMVLTMLTACGGGGSFAPSITPDVSREKQMIGYVQEYVKNHSGIELVEADDSVRSATYSVLPQVVVCMDESLQGKDVSGQKARMMDDFQKKMKAQNKKGAVFMEGFVAFLTQEGCNNWFDFCQITQYINELRRQGAEPKAVSVAATTRYNASVGTDIVYIMLVLVN